MTFNPTPEEKKAIAKASRRLCPILSTSEVKYSPGPYCIEERCAWWDLNVGQCAMLHASVVLSRIEAKLESVVRQDMAGYSSVAVSDWG